MSRHQLGPSRVHYPESDGKPMGESDLHRSLMIDLIVSLDHHFRDDPEVYVTGDLLLYYEDGNPRKVVVPDLFLVRGVRKGPRRIYKLWEEKKGPELVVEVTSRSTHRVDLGKKRELYERLGVREYFLFDPEGINFQPQLQGFRLAEGRFRPLAGTSAEGGALAQRSEVAGLELHGRGSTARWVDPRTRKALPVPNDLYQQIDIERNRAEEERRRAAAAEAEAARLREELSRLRGERMS